MRALFESLPLAPDQHLLLLYFARTDADVLFRSELDHLAARRGGRVEYVLGGAGSLTTELLQQRVPGLAGRNVYFCGPPGMSGAVRRALRGAGLPDRQLHEERFAL